MNTFSPKVVLTSSLNVTATEVAVAQPVADVEVVVTVVAFVVAVLVAVALVPLLNTGHAVLVAELYGPVAEVATQTAGTLLAFGSPHDAGTTLLRAATMVKNDAYDHVRSAAERGVPSDFENCSDRAPLEGVYFCTTAT